MKLRYLLLIFSFMFLMSCEKFVDEPRPEADVSADAVFSSPEGVRAFLTGTYRRIRFFNDGVGDDSEGYGSILNSRTVQGNDFVQPAFQWMAFEYRYIARTNPIGRKTLVLWNLSYEVINSMNVLIAGVEKSSLAESLKKELIAEARAIRGYMYFEAVQEYARPYAAGRNNVGIPIYLEPSSVQSTGSPRKSVGDVYDVIRRDLEFASTNLSIERDAKWRINKTVADGLLARVYLHMELWTEAAQAANRARTSFGGALSASSYRDGFDDLSSPEWMWGMPFRNDQTLFFGSFASFWDGTRYTPTIRANPTFVNTFTPTDVRRLFTAAPSGPLFLTSKFNADADFGEDVVLMRVAEMYLIEAEALARADQDGPAADLLFTLQSNRDPNATRSGNADEALINEILLERRKELYAEGLTDFVDNRRLQRAWDRDVNHPEAFRFKFTANDYRFFYLIPQQEIDANPNIGVEDQNPTAAGGGWPAPK